MVGSDFQEKRSKKKDKEFRILINLVERFLHTGKAVGSQSLQESNCSDMSSATIRNYFASLEKEGYIKQQHTSGGRTPLAKAYREYAKYSLECVEHLHEPSIVDLPSTIETHAIVSLLQTAAKQLSEQSGVAVAISAPRFDHDMVKEVQFVFIDVERVLAVIVTEFGLVHTEVLSLPFSVSHALLRKADRFARARLYREKEELCIDEDFDKVLRLYQEAMASFFVNYSSLSQEDMWRSGFYRLFQTTEFDDSYTLSSTLSLFENSTALRGCMRETMRAGEVRFWIGEDLQSFVVGESSCALLAAPYFVGARPIGALCMASSMAVLYGPLFQALIDCSKQLSDILTRSLMHHQISYRVPESHAVLPKELLDFSINPQLEHKNE